MPVLGNNVYFFLISRCHPKYTNLSWKGVTSLLFVLWKEHSWNCGLRICIEKGGITFRSTGCQSQGAYRYISYCMTIAANFHFILFHFWRANCKNIFFQWPSKQWVTAMCSFLRHMGGFSSSACSAFRVIISCSVNPPSSSTWSILTSSHTRVLNKDLAIMVAHSPVPGVSNSWGRI